MSTTRVAIRRAVLLAAGAAWLAMVAGVAPAAVPAPQRWIATWAASPQAPFAAPAARSLEGRTIRERMRVSVGGARLRIRISNEFGHKPLVLGSVTIGRPLDPATVAAGSLRQVTFGGSRSITVPPGAPAVSDAIDFRVAAGEEISISLYLARSSEPPTEHSVGLKTAIISPPGDFTQAVQVEMASKTEATLLVTAISVPAKRGQKLVVAFGDSITDGNNSTVDADRNWPGNFLRRLRQLGKGDSIAVVGQAIAGNRLREDGAGPSALARFDRDVLALPGVTHLVVLEGINDIGWPGAKFGDFELAPASALPSAADLIGAYRQLIARARAHGIKVIGGTLLPFKGTDAPGYYSEAKEPLRAAVNEWIRGGGEFDAVIDFDRVMRDPADPHRTLPKYASFDIIHPSNEGYQAMADAVDPKLFD
ncbi:MAG: SGNH/GDSL hydrolase family protein [Gammaproteobacteria bacterium]|nr:SGNH/GDSL hydrolase family protein [Gammaproteobacteria bacterium]